MTVTTISSREQDTAGAKKAGARFTAPAANITDLLALPQDVEFEPAPVGPLFHPAELG